MGARYRNQGENAAPGQNELPEKTGKENKTETEKENKTAQRAEREHAGKKGENREGKIWTQRSGFTIIIGNGSKGPARRKIMVCINRT